MLFPVPVEYQGETAWGLLTSCWENVRVTQNLLLALLFLKRGAPFTMFSTPKWTTSGIQRKIPGI